jgi:ribonuclease R
MKSPRKRSRSAPRKAASQGQSQRKYAPPPHSDLMQGIISVHAKGFGFVKGEKGSPDVFIPKQFTMDAVDGDLVEVEVNPIVSAKGPEGVVVAILKRSRTHLAGTIMGSLKQGYIAYAPLLGLEKSVIVKSEEPLQEGARIICKVVLWNNEQGAVEGVLTRLIGHISDPSIDVQAAIEEFGLLSTFSIEALEEARSFGKKVTANSSQDRKDLTELECITIDPDTARDFDDAISLSLDEKGHFHLGVHIADVAHYVRPDSHLDKEAASRSNSTYFPGQCIPMLPEELSNELCSLKPKVNRLTQSMLAEFDPSGTLLHYEIVRTLIKSRKRFSYKEALAVLEKKEKSPHAPLLERMVALCHLLKRKRMERGSIDFSMSDDVIIVDSKGVPLKMERVEYDITHQMIEEFMLKANEIVATHLSSQGKKLIYRVHEEPTAESFKDFYTFARSLGFTLPAQPVHRDIQKLFQEAKDSPLLPQLSISFIRSMRLACYSADNIGHYGLALDYYCHFTSPIRRYTDLIIQRLLFDEVAASCDIDAISAACSEKERISFRAESSVVLLKKLRLANTYFEADPTRVYSAIITKIKPFALFFEVALFDLEGSFHVSEIGNDFYEYNPNKMMFRGSRTGKTFVAGQPIEVRLDRINYILQQTQWSLVAAPAATLPFTKKRGLAK